MTQSSKNILFWCLLAAQGIGSQLLIWTGAPLYNRLRSSVTEDATSKEVMLLFVAVFVMQGAHWLVLPLKKTLTVRRHVLLGHVLICIGELSLFFSAALTSLIVLERFGNWKLEWWRLLLLVTVVFSATSYKYLITLVGAQLIETEPGAAKDAGSPSKEICHASHES